MKTKTIALLALSTVALASAGGQAMMNVIVGGAPMMGSRDIVDNAVNSKKHTTLVAAVKAAGLVNTLKSKGPFTVFAPTNDAFENLPEGTVDTLLQPDNKAMLTKVLTAHVVAGRMDSRAIMKAIRKGHGVATLRTVSGDTLRASMNGPTNVVLMDESGNTATISTYDVPQRNGVIHVVDTVLVPR